MKKWIIAGVVVLASGCAATSTPISSTQTAQKSAIDICASTGAALQAMVIAGATGALQQVKPEAVALHPLCNQATPSNAVTAAESAAYEKLIQIAAPYMGD